MTWRAVSARPYSGALNGGQFPLSVVALGAAAAAAYRTGIYGRVYRRVIG
jgi:hypothetical protein